MQLLMTSKIRSRIEHLLTVYNAVVLLLCSELMTNLASLTGFNTIS